MASGAGTDHGGDTHDDHSHGYGGEGGSNINLPRPPIHPTIKSQIFIITCTGMKPDTVHKFYYEGQDLSSECMPIDPKPPGTGHIRTGDPLKTDEGGRIKFAFYFTVKIEKQVDAANKTRYELAGDKKFLLQAVDSTASKMVKYARGPREPDRPQPHPYVAPTGNQH